MTTTPPSGHLEPSALQKSLTDLITESQELRSDVHGAERARRRAGTINLALLGVLVAFVGLLLVVTFQNNRLSHRVTETNTRMADCTTPGGRCYDEGRTRSSAAIADLIRSQMFMAECARLFPDEAGAAYDAKLEACVLERLNGPTVRTPAAPGPSPAPSRSPGTHG
jgi:hypothetical protein